MPPTPTKPSKSTDAAAPGIDAYVFFSRKNETIEPYVFSHCTVGPTRRPGRHVTERARAATTPPAHLPPGQPPAQIDAIRRAGRNGALLVKLFLRISFPLLLVSASPLGVGTWNSRTATALAEDLSSQSQRAEREGIPRALAIAKDF